VQIVFFSIGCNRALSSPNGGYMIQPRKQGLAEAKPNGKPILNLGQRTWRKGDYEHGKERCAHDI